MLFVISGVENVCPLLSSAYSEQVNTPPHTVRFGKRQVPIRPTTPMESEFTFDVLNFPTPVGAGFIFPLYVLILA